MQSGSPVRLSLWICCCWYVVVVAVTGQLMLAETGMQDGPGDDDP